jgi:hypothetical protein
MPYATMIPLTSRFIFTLVCICMVCTISSSNPLIFPRKSTISSYAALGDSYATGAGAGNPIPSIYHPLCPSFSDSYPIKIASDPSFLGVKFTNLACGGATTSSVRRTQVPFIGDADVVSITVGGNEVEFFNLVNECVYLWHPARGCARQIKISRALIEGEAFGRRVEDMIRAARGHMASNGVGSLEKGEREEKQKRLLVTGYARFFNDTTDECDDRSFSRRHPEAKLTKALRAQLNGLMDTMNERIRRKCVEGGAEYVDLEGAFEGRRFCEGRGKAWFFGEPPGDEQRLGEQVPLERPHGDVEALNLWDFARVFHPTERGHEAIKGTILEFLGKGN